MSIIAGLYRPTRGSNTDAYLSPTAVAILGLILHRAAAREPFPTVRELCSATGFRSPNGTNQHLRRLRALGLIAFEDGLARTARPLCRFIPADQLEQS